MKKMLLMAAVASALCSGSIARAQAPAEVTPHTWHITLHSPELDPGDALSRVTLSRTQIRAQLSDDTLTDEALERYVRDRIHLDHAGTRCVIIGYRADQLEATATDRLGIFVRFSCEDDIHPERLVVSSTLFAEQRHPIPLLLSISSARTTPPKLLARTTFDGTRTVHPDGAQLSVRDDSEASPKKVSVAILYALGTLGVLALLGGLFYRWSTTTR